LSKAVVLFVIVIACIIVAFGLYLAVPYFLSTSSASNNISVQSVSLNTSDSNLSALVNVITHSPLIRMGVYINGTYIGSCNYTYSGSMMRATGNYMSLTTRRWSNGSYTMMFSLTPRSMPMMSRIHMTAGAIYMIRIEAFFQDGTTYNATSIREGQNGISGMMISYYSVQEVSVNAVTNAMRSPPSDAKIVECMEKY
jgi:hypothetical protein